MSTCSYSLFTKDKTSLRELIKLSSVGAFSAAVAIRSSKSILLNCLSPQASTSCLDKADNLCSISSPNLQGKRLFTLLSLLLIVPLFLFVDLENPPFDFEGLCFGIGGLCSLSGFTSKGIKVSFNLSLAI